MSDGGRQSNLDAIAQTLARLRENFDGLKSEYARLGAENDAGIRSKLRTAAADVERVIGLDMSWLQDDTAHRLIEALLSMRRYEASYMVDRSFADRAAFNAEFGKFIKIIDGVVAAEILKTQIRQTVRNYADAFEGWIACDGEIARHVASIDADGEFLIRSADANVVSSNEQRAQASAALNRSQLYTRNLMSGVGLATVLLGLCFGLWIGRTITRPLHGLADVMKQLAGGDTSARVPATHARDEIGAMARAVVVFRDNMIERAAALCDTGRKRARPRTARREHRGHHLPFRNVG